MYLWVKSFHIVFMVTWFAALFYLPRLYVYHAMSDDEISNARFKTMERKLYWGIMAPGGVLTVLTGAWLVYIRGAAWFLTVPWLHLKLVLVGLLVGYHIYLGVILKRFARDGNRHSDKFYRWINEAPIIVLVGAILLAELKPWQKM
jgi:protoporphyrinogen IX oxidase